MRVSARQRLSKSCRKPVFKRFFIFLFVVCAVLVSFYLFFIEEGRWNGKDRLSLVLAQKDGSVKIGIFDPAAENLTLITIPKNTEIKASYQMGNWQLGSIWKLGQNEKLGGDFLSSSIMKTFKFPIDAWIAEEGSRMVESGYLGNLRLIFSDYPSNLTLKDKLRLALFLIKLKKGRVSEIDLSQSNFLEKTQLVTGDEGYVLKGNVSSKISKLFAVDRISQEQARVGILNASGNSSLVIDMVEIVENLGSKVVSVQEVDDKNIDCEIRSLKLLTGKTIARVFSCKFLKEKAGGNLDVEVKVGNGFAKRF